MFLDVLYDALREYSYRRFESFEVDVVEAENRRLSDKIIQLETKIDSLVDREGTMETRVDYWRKMYISICRKYKVLQKRYQNCPKKSIILYR